MHGSAENRAVLLGSTVSPAWLAVSSPQTNNGACPWCNMHGHWLHLAWECPQIPEAHRRPQRPPTFLASRFGWPTKNTPEDRRTEVLQWLSHVQGLIWQERYNWSSPTGAGSVSTSSSLSSRAPALYDNIYVHVMFLVSAPDRRPHCCFFCTHGPCYGMRWIGVGWGTMTFLELAHQVDATQWMGLGVGLGGVKFLHFEGKITSVVHSHPPSRYIRKHAPGWVLVMFTIHRMQNKTECLRFHASTLQCANAKTNFMQFHCVSLVWNWTAVVFGTALSCFSVWRTSPPPSLQQACCSPPLGSQPFGAEWHAFWRSVNHIT